MLVFVSVCVLIVFAFESAFLLEFVCVFFLYVLMCESFYLSLHLFVSVCYCEYLFVCDSVCEYVPLCVCVCVCVCVCM